MSTDTLKGRLEIRLSPADRDAVLAAAKRDGVNKSEWCRRVFATVLSVDECEPYALPIAGGFEGYQAACHTCGPFAALVRENKDDARDEAISFARACRGQVETGPSGDEGSALAKPSGPTPVPSENPQKGIASEGVRPAAQSQTCKHDGGKPCPPNAPGCDCGSDAEAKPKRITQPERDLMAELKASLQPRRADVGPKPVSATKPRPKATKAKGKR